MLIPIFDITLAVRSTKHLSFASVFDGYFVDCMLGLTEGSKDEYKYSKVYRNSLCTPDSQKYRNRDEK